MSVIFRERPKSRATTANPPSTTYNYVAYGTVDQNEVQATAYLLTPVAVNSQYGILYRQDIRITPEGADHWDVQVLYTSKRGDFTISFDTTGGTFNRKVSVGTVNSYKATGEAEDPPDFKGAIDVQDDGSVNGTELVAPALKLNVHFKHPLGVINLNQIKAIARLAGCVNSNAFLGFDDGEVLFLGATGQEGTDVETEVTYQFACSENLSNATLGPFTGVTKRGWDILWVKFKNATDGGSPVVQPRWMFIERVYYAKPFNQILGFG